jgi:glycosyltransferase involved in cell wall biosynthesis
MPLRPGRPTVVTVHDVTFFTEPEQHAMLSSTFFKAAIRTAIRRAARIVVPSMATRDELVQVLGVDPARIDVAHHGVDHQVFHRPTGAEVAAVTARLGLRGGPYVAYLGSLAARKNVAALVQGWAGAVGGLPEPPALVLAGGGGWSDEVDAAVAQVPPELRVVRPGYLPFRDLAGFYGGAQVVAFPSRGEGFGLPVLEAMACGAAVLTTRRTSLPEVGGDAVAYTEPDAASVETALRELLSSPSRRASLGAAGYVRSQEFTWAASASAHVASYKRAAEDGVGGATSSGAAGAVAESGGPEAELCVTSRYVRALTLTRWQRHQRARVPWPSREYAA